MSEVNNYDIASVSEGVQYLAKGYIDYAKEVIVNRALPDLRDGLKPVNRRILYTLKGFKSKSATKSARMVGDAMGKYHPHGDSSIYEAAALMTDKNGSYAFPLIEGTGNFGAVYKTDKAAAMRYTEMMLSPNAKELFGEMNGIQMIPNFDSTESEPVVLPASFPMVLVNSTSGIAVGFHSNIPSFNFTDVCNLVKEYIKDGECSTVICPDFVTGGYYIKNNKELMKLMRTGKAKLKLRGKATRIDKTINVTEVPFGKTIQSLMKQINSKDIRSIKNAYNADDFDKAVKFVINCRNKQVVEEAEYALYRDTDFQYSYSADITVIEDDVPKRLGVWQIIEKWVEWRRSVILADEKINLDALLEAEVHCKAFIELVKDVAKRDEFVKLITHEGKPAGIKFLRDNFDKNLFTEEVCDWCATRRLAEFHKGGKYLDQLASYTAQIKRSREIIANVDAEISKQMDRLISQYGASMPRLTEVTNVDYEFLEEEEEQKTKIQDTSTCYFNVEDGFLRKLKYRTKKEGMWVEGVSSDTLIALDNRGRILRLYCEDIPFTTDTDMSFYIPRYCNLNESDDYRITWVGRLYGQKLMLIYKDGNIGFIDTSEWINNSRNVRVLERGIACSIADQLGDVINLDDIEEFDSSILMVSDTLGRLGWEYLRDIKQKDRTAKTRMVATKADCPIDSYMICTEATAVVTLSNMSEYHGKLKKLTAEDFRGNPEMFVFI